MDVPAVEERKPLTVAESADLEAAWAELRQTAAASKVTSLRACSRNGRSWAEDPEAVRAIAATIGRITNDRAEGPKDRRTEGRACPVGAGRRVAARPVPV
ncbi:MULTISPECIES: hypothetical protein [unclassified Arthrobacter]|uniref:hypothetical protein n=1 Tax=unclassified Arthrobacter TaxID=235627 RepID=UPI0028831163|nr:MULTISPECIES: hypothetical protein [unclassified Arthrobacter]